MNARTIRSQRGAALLVMAAILGIGICALLVTSLNSATFDQTTAARKRSAEALQEAKTALIGHVAREVLNLANSVPGQLPCPESPADAGTDNEGVAAATCEPAAAVTKTVGRLPWRTLGIDKVVDGGNEPLWYAVSPNWVRTSAALPTINSGTPGQLVMDTTAAGVVAVIIAPGRPLDVSPNANQIAEGCTARQQARADRSHNPASAANPNYLDYLECQNASSPIDASFVSAVVDNDANRVINDQVVFVTAADILNAIQGPLAERLQRTVAPLLSEYTDLWGGTGNFSPYAVPFVTPEAAYDLATQCGPAASLAQEVEGLLPLAPNAAGCASTWNGFAVSGSITSLGCTTLVTTNVRCSFHYYRLTGLGQVLLGSVGSNTTDVTIEATAPHAAASFRQPLLPSQVIVPAGLTAETATFTPRTDGDARLSLVVRITSTNLCDNVLLGLVCNILPGVVATSTLVSVEFPQLAASTTLTGSKLSAAVLAAHPAPYTFHTPANTAPHYWFMQNQWYRYTYYSVSPNASAAATAGSHITVNGFPTVHGNSTNDKRFVLALMGPAVTGQARAAGAPLTNYLEDANNSPGDRTFAWQVYAQAGNDRLATCPFRDSAGVVCD